MIAKKNHREVIVNREATVARRADSPVLSRLLLSGAVIWMLAATSAAAVDPAQRTADMPDSWLVLYNLNDPFSVAWAAWYQAERGIPSQNMVGLDASTSEHLDTLQEVQDQIIAPVRDLLAADPQLEQSIMGIVLGYHLPGHYERVPQDPNTGGFSVADALQDMFDDSQPPANQFDSNFDNPHVYGNILPAGGRLTKATMLPNRYMVARIDAPSFGAARALTEKAKALAQSDATLYGQNVCYDFFDPNFPANNSDEWYWLREAVECSDLASLPWAEFDIDGQAGPALPWNDAFRFGIYKLFGWSAADFAGENPGSRVLAYELISFGGITVRSTLTDGGVYVPNAIEAGYAAAIGATGEPGTVVAPFPDTLLAALEQGWTLGEAFYLAKPFDDLVWNLVGDPFLTLPNWFDAPPQPAPGDGDINGDGLIDGHDIQAFADVLTGADNDPTRMAAADLDGNGTLDDDDVFLMLSPLVFDSLDSPELRGSGDANGDRLVNGQDIRAFVLMLLNGTDGVPLRAEWGADMNQDTLVTLDDLPLFVDALLNPPF